jgi:Protein of unknown function (DUF2380)
LAGATGAFAATPPRSIAVFDFEFVNTSLETTTPAEADRLQRLGDALRRALDESGHYTIVGTEAIRAAAQQLPSLRNCNGCELTVARAAGADAAAYGWVQKVSNLILNLNLVVEDAATGRHIAVGSVDIRGNTDDSWRRGLQFLLREHILKD